MDHGQAALASSPPERGGGPNTIGFMHRGGIPPQPPPHMRHPLQSPPQWPYYAAAHHAVPGDFMPPQAPPFMNPPYHGLPPNEPTAANLQHPSSESPRHPSLPLSSGMSHSFVDPNSLPMQSVSRPHPPSAAHVSLGHRNFTPPLPWYSVSPGDFPRRSRKGRRRKPPLETPSLTLELPPQASSNAAPSDVRAASKLESNSPGIAQSHPLTEIPGQLQEPARSPTPATSQSPSETDSTQPTTPSSLPRPRPSQSNPGTRNTGKIVPAVPVAIPQQRSARPAPAREKAQYSQEAVPNTSTSASVGAASMTSDITTTAASSVAAINTNQNVAPKSWADLVKTKVLNTATANGENGHLFEQRLLGSHGTRTRTLAEVLKQISGETIRTDNEIVSLKPRGLVNTGNMCYMNSVLQVLLFCAPFYEFLSNISSYSTQSFSNSTPMIDNMVNFFREFALNTPSSQASNPQPGAQTKAPKPYGEPFTPDFLYDVIRTLPRFSSMRRGHQQDAEEFLGFLLEELHQECVKSVKNADSDTDQATRDNVAVPRAQPSRSDDQGWLEVGRRQRPTVTRSSGFMGDESPITRIFGGKLRSELRVPGAKSSVTSEPYQSLQLDIGSPQVENIADALRGLARSEQLQGEFSSPRGSGVAATKQVFVEAVPPVLILHLKRFQYDNTGGTQKIWKMVGYPLELDIPKEIFPAHRRAQLAMVPLRYKLVGVIYHHGKNASGGHYTADVRYRDNDTWIRLDDTMITDVRKEDVAVCGSGRHPEQADIPPSHRDSSQGTGEAEYDRWHQPVDDTSNSRGWSQVHRTAPPPMNGLGPKDSTSRKSSPGRTSFKDDRVAYLLFYQRLVTHVQAAA